MRYVFRTILALLALLVFAFLHYTLPQHDIVRIVGTENRRIDIGENSWFWAMNDVGTVASTSRDIFFINAVLPNGKTMEYRNEDTGWGWPPYFKMDSFSTQTQAKELISSANAPIWVMVTHYGWRNQLFTIFPNAIALRKVEGPDVTIIPWVNIILLSALVALFLLVRAMWRQFRERMIEPAVIEIEETADSARGWFRRVFRRRKG